MFSKERKDSYRKNKNTHQPHRRHQFELSQMTTCKVIYFINGRLKPPLSKIELMNDAIKCNGRIFFISKVFQVVSSS